MDGDLSRVARLLCHFAEPLAAVGYRAEESNVLELGPGKTHEVLAAFVLAGAKAGTGLDVSVDLPEGHLSDDALRNVAALLSSDAAEFLSSVSSSGATVERRLVDISRSHALPVRVRRYNGWSIPLPSESIDLVFSRSVLEHVANSQVASLLRELRRILRPGGGMVHAIDMRDHMHLGFPADGESSGFSNTCAQGDWLDALTYPDWLYRAMFSRSVCRINRIRVDEWLRLFVDAGFTAVYREDDCLDLPGSATSGRLLPRWRSVEPSVLSVAQVTLGLN
jgi:SAM-dependent methyltransferase